VVANSGGTCSAANANTLDSVSDETTAGLSAAGTVGEWSSSW